MQVDLDFLRRYQVFLNYPFDQAYLPFAEALSFGVAAAGMVPVTALDLTVPDTGRLEMLVKAITSCHYSAHDLSRCRGEGPDNLTRMNMPIEMGMAMFHALSTQRADHRCAFFVPNNYAYQQYASDLSGLDPLRYGEDPASLLAVVYEWLRDVGPSGIVSVQPTVDVIDAFAEFNSRRDAIDGAGPGGLPSHAEVREVMYQVCANQNWWDLRGTKMGKARFPEVPLRLRARP
jgi:hypothetical protein